MNKPLNVLIGTIAFLILLIVGLLIFLTVTVDPNDYRDDIETTVKDSTGVNLSIDGEIDWTFYPWLGFEIRNIQVRHQDDSPFTQLKAVKAQVELLSLFRKSPNISQLSMDGLTIELYRDKDGNNNWDNLTASKESSGAPKRPGENQATTATNPSGSLQVFISEIRITNTRIHFRDDQAGVEWALDPVDLTAENITPDRPFPVSLAFSYTDLVKPLGINGTVSTEASFSRDIQRFELNSLLASLTLSGGPFSDKTVPLTLKSRLVLDQKAKQLQVERLILTLANLSATADLLVSELSAPYPQLKGSVEIAPFSVRKLLAQLGQAPVTTANPNVLEHLAFRSSLASDNAVITTRGMTLQADDTTVTSEVRFDRQTGHVRATLKADQFNADDYLPPPASGAQSDPAATPPNGEVPPPAEPAQDTELPVELLRSLNFDLAVMIEKLRLRQLNLASLRLNATARNGKLQLKEASGKLYNGSFLVQSELDATQPVPVWTMNETLEGVVIQALLSDLAYPALANGIITLHSSLKASGKSVNELKEHATGTARFQVENAVLEQINLKALACQGIAKLRGKSVDTSSWPRRTQFDAIQGTFAIKGPLLNNEQLVASVSGIAVEGRGLFKASEAQLNYDLGLKVLGDLGDPACEINKYLKEAVIPVKCVGDLANGAPKCGLDTEKLGKMAETLLKQQAEKKLDKLLDKKLDKFFGSPGADKDKNPEDASTRDTGQEKKAAVKNALKGLFQ